MKKLILIDGNSILYRAYYALPKLKTSSGVPTGAIYGFTTMLLNIIENQKPDYISVAFDLKEPTFRHKEYKEYKANRAPMADELVEQLENVKNIIKTFGIKVLETPGYEADDIIATIANKNKEETSVEIYSGDSDLLQIVDKNIFVNITVKGIKEIRKYTKDEVLKEYELEPKQLIDYKAIKGDQSDNIEGIEGIGPKTAIKLLKEHKDIEGILANVERIKEKQKLKDEREKLLLNKKLIALKHDVPLSNHLDDLKLEIKDKQKLFKMLKQLEFRSLLPRVSKIFNIKEEKAPEKEESLFSYETPEEKREEVLFPETESFEDKERIAFDFIKEDNEIKAIYKFRDEIKEFFIKETLFGNEELKNFLELLKEEKLKKYTVNLKEKIKLLLSKSIEFDIKARDILTELYLLNPDLKNYSFENLRASYLKKYEKERSKEERVKDIFALSFYLDKELEKFSLFQVLDEIETPISGVLALMEDAGVNIDKNCFKILSKDFKEKLNIIEEKIFNLAGEEFNVSSVKQLQVILFEKLKLPVIKKIKTGASTDTEVLGELKERHPIIPLILEHRHISKLLTTYIETLPELTSKSDLRIHPTFLQWGTSTGRIACVDPNLQNIPIKTELGREIRKAFISRNEDYLLVSADYSQIDLRVLAHLSEDKNLLDAFRRDEDIHSYTAGLIFGIKKEEITPEMRRRAKTINFGIIYGMSPFGLSKQLQISKEEAKSFIDTYFKKFEGIKAYFEKTIQDAKRDLFVKTVSGRIRRVPNINSRNNLEAQGAIRIGFNATVQGSSADIIKIAMINIDKKLKDKKSKMILQIHDELLFDVHKSELESVKRIVRDEMENAWKLKVPLKVSMGVGKNWSELE